ncbi:hypothetical protein FGO68_gene17005 [Halteria grandinella]|uniref:Uncharacterized protein n=1 Tax=Halteria grandinella TaxID=5974 RepID=A0A8J8N9L7_HALGN|nr:hypothetical protein FGO68_gene17005 [Halteria grandinella]
MRESFTLDQIRRFSLIAVLIGVVIGVSGAVRTGSIIISLSASIFILARYSQSPVKRGIELVLPITICALLFILALSLPDARQYCARTQEIK